MLEGEIGCDGRTRGEEGEEEEEEDAMGFAAAH